MSEKAQKPPDYAPVINLAGICKSFGSRVVLDAISLQLTGGRGLCICGANAVGKTTLLRIITATLQPSDGVAEVCGFNVQTQAQEIKPLIGAIFHQSMVYPQLTVIENLRFFARLYGVKNSKTRIEKLLEQAGLTPYRYDSAGILSRGMTQRLAIARALVHKPIILLADEPFTGLDSEASKHLVTILRNFKDEGGTVVMTTHNVNLPLQCCEQVAVLDDHKLIFNAKVSEINTAEFAQDYLSYARVNSNIPPAGLDGTTNANPTHTLTNGSQLKSLASAIKAIFTKDLVSEFRAKQALPAMIILGVLIAWVFRIATEAAPVDTSVTAAAVLLVAILFSAILASERIFAVEQQNNCISALLLAPVDAGDIYIGKLLVNIAMLCIFEIVTVPAVFVLFNINVSGKWLGLVTTLLLANIGISSVGTLLGCVVQGTKAASSLLSILVMAVLCPMMIPAIFTLLSLFGAVGGEVVGAGALAMVGDFKTALGYMTAFGAIFVTVCWLLFGFVVGEPRKR